MDKEYIRKITAEFAENSPTNFLSPIAKTEEELEKLKNDFYANSYNINNTGSARWDMHNQDKPDEYVGMRFFKTPLVAFGSAADEGFLKLKEPGVIGPHHYLPTEWLPGAKTVISIFIPFTQRVIESNTVDKIVPSKEWRYARVDGQAHLLATGAIVRDALNEAGYKAIIPQIEADYWGKVGDDGDDSRPLYSTNWAERHVAFVTGLGTFGLGTNFISKAGTCGRLVSIITDWETPPDEKDYVGIYDYCSQCKACFRACPADALFDGGKTVKKCSEFIRKMTSDATPPRVGCGKCMAGMPCQTSNCGPKAG